MATSYYSIGTVTLVNGSKSVVGNGTGWQIALIKNGYIAVEAAGNLLPIATVDSDAAMTTELAWTGASGTYNYAIQRNPQQLQDNAENSRALAYLLSEMRNGTLFKYDAAGPLEDRVFHDAKPKGFGYLVFAGTTALLYVKNSNTSGDWAGPFAYGTGPIGPEGPVGFLDWRGTYSAGTAYVANDGVYYNGSAWVALQATAGNAPPNLPTTENANWSLLAAKGMDGTGIGDMLSSVYDPTNQQRDVFADINTRSRLMNFVQGMELSNSTLDPANDVIIAPGRAQGFGLYVANLAPATKRLDALWAKGSGQGGLDVGTKQAGLTYHFHAIREDSTGDGDYIASRSPVAPTMPSGWSRVERLGAVRTAGSAALLPFRQSGNNVFLNQSSLDFANTANRAFAPFNISVPEDVTTIAILRIMAISAAGAVLVVNTDNIEARSTGPLYQVYQGTNLTYGTNVINFGSQGTPHPSLAWELHTVGWIDTTVPRI